MRSARSPNRRRPRLGPLDRSILALALPALGSLAADPLYSVADTAFVGHLGTEELGAVAIGSAAFNASFWLFSFLAYGVTPRVAGALGARDDAAAASVGVHALFVACLLGAGVTAFGTLFAGPIVEALGASGGIAAPAESYLRIRVLSALPVLLVTVGHGWLRGAQDTRTPMLIVGVGAALNVALDYLFIYPLGWGVAGAAWATLAGQVGAALAFVVVLSRRMTHARWRIERSGIVALLRVGADLVVRAGALVAALTIATAVAARMGVVELGAWQVGMQVFSLLALTLDSIAIAGQALVGRYLGAGAPEDAILVARRLLWWGSALGVGIALGLGAARVPVARIFSDDPAVVAAAASLLGWLALAQPLSAAAFTLDGILIGASDTRFLALAMVGASSFFAAASLASLELGWGLGGLAASAGLWLAVRTVTLTVRFRGRAPFAAQASA